MNVLLRKAIKGGVLACGKSVKNQHAEVWVIAVPDIKAQGRTLREAENHILERIWAACNLDEPIALRYEDNSTTSLAQLESIVQVNVNEVTDIADPSRYFERGFCSTCQSGLGRRNNEKLQIVQKPKSGLSGIHVRFQPFLKCGMRVGMNILQASICEKLKLECDPLLEFREVCLNGKRLPEFYEVIPTFFAPCVVPLARKSRIGGKCSKCGAQFIYNDPGKIYISLKGANVIRRHGAAAIDSLTRPTLSITAKIWEKIRKDEASQGLLSAPVIELDEARICSKPKLEKILPFKL